MTRLHVLLVLALPLATLPAMACGMEVEDDSISLASLMADVEAVAVAVVEPLLADDADAVETEAAEVHAEGVTLSQATSAPLTAGSVEAASLRPVAVSQPDG